MLGDVSVIIPTWNRAATIENAIRSVLEQTLPVKEILVCDDGSNDTTEDIVRAYAGRNVTWCPGPHTGRPAIPRNRGTKRSTGEWIAFLDSDDTWITTKLEIQLLAAEESCCKAVSSNARRRSPNGCVNGNVLDICKKRLSFDDLLVSNSVICSSAVIHRSLLPTVEGFPEEPALKAVEDYALWLRVATQTDIACINDSLVDYRDDPKTSIRKGSEDVWTQRKHILNDFLSWANRHDVKGTYTTVATKQLRWLFGKRLIHKGRNLLLRRTISL